MSSPRNIITRRKPEPVAKRAIGPREKSRIQALRRAPRKWADPERTETTPEHDIWVKSNRPRFDAMAAGEQNLLHGHGDRVANHGVYFPEKHGKDLNDGAWVFVTKPPRHPGIPEVPLLSLWWARPHILDDGVYGDRRPYQGLIMTADGPLHLWPHEYVVCPNPQAFTGMAGSHIHSLGGDAVIEEDHLFYFMSRGISRHAATLMLFDQIEREGVAYVTFDEEVVDFFNAREDAPGVSALEPIKRSLRGGRRGHGIWLDPPSA